MICGSVKINDSSSNNDTSIKHYTSMINHEMINLLEQSKSNVDVIKLESTNTITDNVKIVHARLKG